MRNLFRAGCLFAVVVLSSCAGDSSDSQPATGTKTSATGTAVLTQSVVLTTDPTGLVPTATAKGLAIQLDGRYQNAVMARRNADGTLSVECHDEQDAAEAFVQGGQTASTQNEVK
jgi:type 1 fimbria pilin